jgi:hypothetical protein
MDRKAGYKECPRCGLRNKPSALQCDFCGLRFIAGEDWDDNIQALEKMGDSDERVLVDEDVSKRIEATIVKRDKINAPVKTKEPERSDNDYYQKPPETVQSEPVITKPVPPIVVPKVTVAEPILEASPVEPAPEPVKAEPEPEKIIIKEPQTVEAAPVAEPRPEPKRVKEKKVVRRVVRPVPKVFAPVKHSVNKAALTAVLAIGAIGYLVAMMIGDNTLGRTGGWVMVTVSSMMVVVGAVGLFVPRTGKEISFAEVSAPGPRTSKEVLICPKCHELVKETDKACPDCGSEFRSD